MFKLWGKSESYLIRLNYNMGITTHLAIQLGAIWGMLSMVIGYSTWRLVKVL